MNCTPDYAFDKLRRLTQERKRGTGGEFRGDQPCDAPQPGDRCGRYCCIEVCTCPTPKGTLKKPPLDPNCPDCCDDLENCAQAGGPGITADDCIGGNKGCVVLGSEYFQKCELKKGRAAKRIEQSRGGGGGHWMPYGPDWPGKPMGAETYCVFDINSQSIVYCEHGRMYLPGHPCADFPRTPCPTDKRTKPPSSVKRVGMVTYRNCSDLDIQNFQNLLAAACKEFMCCLDRTYFGEEKIYKEALQCIQDICSGKSQVCIDCAYYRVLCDIGYMAHWAGCILLCGRGTTSPGSIRAIIHELVHYCHPTIFEGDLAQDIETSCFGKRES